LLLGGVSLWEKLEAVATKVYHASEITANTKVRERIKELTDGGYGHLPVCIAKTHTRSRPTLRSRALRPTT